MLTKATKIVVGAVALLLVAAPALADTHWDIQAVDDTGHATNPKVGGDILPENVIVLEGIVLNNPEYMLDGTANYSETAWYLGGQWQIFVQGEGGDHAGTACWMGQNYGNLPWIGDPVTNNYSNEEWNAEMARLNYDGAHQIRMGDRVRITGYAIEYNGKSNINERHNKHPDMNFTVEWLGSAPGLPAPELITLADVKDASDNDIFDETRLTGGEYWQGRLVRINNVSFTDPGLWGPDVEMEITDGAGRTLPCRLGMSDAFDDPSNLGGTFDVIGIFNQEEDYTTGYRIWVMGYDGSADMLGIPEPASVSLLSVGVIAMLVRRRRRS